MERSKVPFRYSCESIMMASLFAELCTLHYNSGQIHCIRRSALHAPSFALGRVGWLLTDTVIMVLKLFKPYGVVFISNNILSHRKNWKEKSSICFYSFDA